MIRIPRSAAFAALAAALVTLFGSERALATPVTGVGDPFNDPIFAGAAPADVTRINFDSAAPGTYASFTQDDVLFRGFHGNLGSQTSLGISGLAGSQRLSNTFGGVTPANVATMFLITVFGHANTVGFNMTANDTPWTVLVATDLGGGNFGSESFTVPAQSEVTERYFALRSEAPILSIFISASPTATDLTFLDNFTLAWVPETQPPTDGVPEPATLGLAGIGAASLLARRRARRA